MGPGVQSPLLGLAPDGVCPAPDVTTGAVSSYLAISPLSALGGRYVSVALSVGSPRPAVSGHPTRKSSDFPPPRRIGAAVARPSCAPLDDNTDETTAVLQTALIFRDMWKSLRVVIYAARAEHIPQAVDTTTSTSSSTTTIREMWSARKAWRSWTSNESQSRNIRSISSAPSATSDPRLATSSSSR